MVRLFWRPFLLTCLWILVYSRFSHFFAKNEKWSFFKVLLYNIHSLLFYSKNKRSGTALLLPLSENHDFDLLQLGPSTTFFKTFVLYGWATHIKFSSMPSVKEFDKSLWIPNSIIPVLPLNFFFELVFWQPDTKNICMSYMFFVSGCQKKKFSAKAQWQNGLESQQNRRGHI